MISVAATPASPVLSNAFACHRGDAGVAATGFGQSLERQSLQQRRRSRDRTPIRLSDGARWRDYRSHLSRRDKFAGSADGWQRRGRLHQRAVFDHHLFRAEEAAGLIVVTDLVEFDLVGD